MEGPNSDDKDAVPMRKQNSYIRFTTKDGLIPLIKYISGTKGFLSCNKIET
jgi:hypothetical protein